MKTDIYKNSFYVAGCFIFLSIDSLLKAPAVYETDLLCWGNTEPGSKSGDKAFESDALDTGNMTGRWGWLFLCFGCGRGRVVAMCQAGLLREGRTTKDAGRRTGCQALGDSLAQPRQTDSGRCELQNCSSKPVEFGHVVVLCPWEVCWLITGVAQYSRSQSSSCLGSLEQRNGTVSPSRVVPLDTANMKPVLRKVFAFRQWRSWDFSQGSRDSDLTYTSCLVFIILAPSEGLPF